MTADEEIRVVLILRYGSMLDATMTYSENYDELTPKEKLCIQNYYYETIDDDR